MPSANKKTGAALLCSHGHGNGADPLIGRDQAKPETLNDGIDYHIDCHKEFALRAVREGYVVFVPEHFPFGRRASKPWSPHGHRCLQGLMHAAHWGYTLVGIRVWEALMGVHFLASLSSAVDPGRIGMVGLSGGGTNTLFAAAIDRRIRVAAVAGYFNTFHDTLESIEHCICNVIPGIGTIADLPDYLGLFAPRSLLLIQSRRDEWFPQRGFEKAFRHLRKIYRVLRAPPSSVETDVFTDSGKYLAHHEFSHRKVWDFFRKEL